MHRFLRRFLSDAQWRGLARLAGGLRALTAATLVRLLRLLPLGVQAAVKESLRPVGKLDYAPSAVRMAVNSRWQVYRLRSCRKEPETIRWLEEHLRPGDVLFDIGANVGAYSLVAHAITEGHARIYAFEPGFATFTELCSNVALNRAQASIVPLQIGLSDRTALLDFRYSDLGAGAAQHSWEGAASQLGAEHHAVHTQPTPCFRMDDLIDRLALEPPTVMKIDVDGPELDVIAGGERTLSDPRLRTILIESDAASEPRLIPSLESRGFRLHQQFRRGTDLSNYVFLRR